VRPDTTFFTVADARFFPGVVCLLNSLRLSGNDVELVVLDVGLTEPQRLRLEPHVRLVEPPGEVLETPMLLKSFPHTLEPDGTVVVIDSDMMVTRSLDPVLERVEAGRVCMFADIEDQRDRLIPEWEEAFALTAPLRRGQHYMNAGFIALSTRHHPELLRRYWELCRRIPSDRTLVAASEYDQPFWGGDQDAINALLMSEVDADAVLELPQEEGPSPELLHDVTIVDELTLECELRGHRPYLLHYWGGPKPWARNAWLRASRDAYVRLMPRVLLGPDVAVRLDPSEVPLWLRATPPGRAALALLSAVNRTSRLLLRHAPKGARRRMASGIRRLAR
jgi:hypothetical protein